MIMLTLVVFMEWGEGCSKQGGGSQCARPEKGSLSPDHPPWGGTISLPPMASH